MKAEQIQKLIALSNTTVGFTSEEQFPDWRRVLTEAAALLDGMSYDLSVWDPLGRDMLDEIWGALINIELFVSQSAIEREGAGLTATEADAVTRLRRAADSANGARWERDDIVHQRKAALGEAFMAEARLLLAEATYSRILLRAHERVRRERRGG